MNTHSLGLVYASSQFASIADASQTGLALIDDFTFEAWVKIDPTNQGYILGKYDTNAQRSYALQAISDGSVLLVVSDDGGNADTHLVGYRCPAGSIISGKWIHIAVSFDISSEQCLWYINGKLVTTTQTNGSTIGATIFDSTTPFAIGARYASGSPSSYLDGKIDDVRVWNDVRSAAEIFANYRIELVGNESNLVGYWKLNDNYLDQTSNNNDLTATNTPLFTKLDVGMGRTANAYSLALALASSQYAMIPDASCPNLEIAGSQTWGCWVKLNSMSLPTKQRFMVKYTNGGTHYVVLDFTADGKPRIQLSGITPNSVTADDVMAVGIWYFIAFVYDTANAKLKLWVNGVKKEVDVTAGTHGDTNAPLTIGADMIGAGPTPTTFLDGLIDEAFIINGALSDSQIATIRDDRPTGSESGLVGYWKFDNNLLDQTANAYHLTPVNVPTFSCYVPFAEAIGDWVELRPDGDKERGWAGNAMDLDGSTLLVSTLYTAGISPGRLWLSKDFGRTFAEVRPAGDTDHPWHGLCSDFDGSFLVASYGHGPTGKLYTSNDAGATWTERVPSGSDEAWERVVCSQDGAIILASASSGRLWLSENSGVNWTEMQPAGNVDEDWYGVAMTPDGSFLMAGVGAQGQSGRLYISDDGGDTWSEVQPAGNVDKEWKSVACSDDGVKLVAVSYSNGHVYISSNSGTSWTDVTPTDLPKYTSYPARVTLSRDGRKINTMCYNHNNLTELGRMYTSNDFGTTWEELQPLGEVDKPWDSFSANPYGTVLLAATYPSRLYLYRKPSDSSAFLKLL